MMPATKQRTPARSGTGYVHFAKLQLRQDSPFSYTCNRCQRCCHHFAIPVSPFDLLRLAQGLGCTTTEVINGHMDGNNRLRRREDGSCRFLVEEGCSVHGSRPLVCRMYPLVRNVTHGEEWFSTLAPALHSAAEWGVDGSVAGYLEGQDAMPSIEGFRLYSELHARLTQRLHQVLADAASRGRADVKPLNLGLFPGGILDPDPSIQGYCRHHNLQLPTELHDKAICHVQAIEAWADVKLKEMRHV
jgi:Fe-S-cluster containining protein